MNERASLVFYNEIDPFAAAWLERLIAVGALPAGVVDRRDIRDIRPDELAGFDQCHFFAGICGWPLALRYAGLEGMSGVWTGSCPCQSFSTAGRRLGFADERHLWPSFFHLIDQRRPRLVVGEQVASKLALEWLDLVHDDLEGAGYAVRAADLCAASVGAPHIRQRLFWMAYGRREGRRQVCSYLVGRGSGSRAQGLDERSLHSGSVVLGHAGISRLPAREREELPGAQRVDEGRATQQSGGAPRAAGALGDSLCEGRYGRNGRAISSTAEGDPSASSQRDGDAVANPGAHDSWSDLVWLPCRDGKARPTQPGLQPLAHGIPNRVGTLRGAGNAIVPILGAEFIKAAIGA